MSHARTSSEVIKTPHSVSLKVLRLSRPTPSQQTPFPPPFPPLTTQPINPAAALSSFSTPLGDSSFILSPLLTLPSSFGTLHAGETFTCTLCINNELPLPTSTSTSAAAPTPTITALRITADIQTPSSTTPIPLSLTTTSSSSSNSEAADNATTLLPPGETTQRILRHHLREEGNHILSITVTYTETLSSPTSPRHSLSGRVRTFRKLYQFGAQSLLGIRTKIRGLPVVVGKARGGGKATWILEAQLENHSDVTVAVEEVAVSGRDGVEVEGIGTEADAQALITPGDVAQVVFLLREAGETAGDEEGKTRNEAPGLAQLTVRWRGSMGEEGSLVTAWLGGGKRR